MYSKINLSEVDTSTPITMMFHRDDVNIVNDRPDVVTIDPHNTIIRARQVTESEWAQLKSVPIFVEMLRMVFGKDLQLPDHPLQMHGSGLMHIVGLLLLTAEAIGSGKTPMWRMPEAYLHPSAQLGLGDLLIFLTKGKQ